MSQENVEIMRAGFQAWNAGNMDAVREAFDPDAEWAVALTRTWSSHTSTPCGTAGSFSLSTSGITLRPSKILGLSE